MVGSWEVNVNLNDAPQKVATAMSKFIEDHRIGAQYNQIAYLGKQVVNGVNHAVLAEQLVISGKDRKNVVLIIFNEAPNTIDLVTTAVERVVESGDELGGINVDVKTEIPEEAQEAFDAAFAGWTGSKVTPIALLATQVVKGTDYIFAAEVSTVTAEPKKTVAIVTVNPLSKQVGFADILNKENEDTKRLGYAFTWYC